MKIGPNNADGVRVDGKTVGAERPSGVRSGTPTDATANASNVDRISLSGASAAGISGDNSIPFDQKKVDEVRQAIQEGRFPVDAKRVAEALLADVGSLMTSPPKADKP